jgi:hypothetical protein
MNEWTTRSHEYNTLISDIKLFYHLPILNDVTASKWYPKERSVGDLPIVLPVRKEMVKLANKS